MKSEIVDVNETRRDLTVEVPSDRRRRSHRPRRRQARPRRRASPASAPARCRPPSSASASSGQIMQDVAEHLVAKRGRRSAGRTRRRADRHARHHRTSCSKKASPHLQGVVRRRADFRSGRPRHDRGDRAARRRSKTKPWTSRSNGCASAPRVTKRSRPASSKPGHTVVVALERQGTDKEGKSRAKPRSTRQVSIELGAPSNPPGFDAEMIGMTRGHDQDASPSPIPTTTRFRSWPAARSTTR